jgi:UDP-GlcNAc:undecaprenyl-phosphate GlcNAc-1-phosphate transferase
MDVWFFTAILFFMAVFFGRVIIPRIVVIAFRKRLFDIADERKDHHGAVPRLGGMAFVPVQCCLFTLAVVLMYKFNFVDIHWMPLIPFFLILVCGLILLYMVGIADDLTGVHYRWKFLVQVIAALLFPLSGLWINDLYGVLKITYLSPWVGMPLTVFVVVLIINAVNLIDGLDGLCSGLVGVGMSILGVLFACEGAWLYAVFAFITAGVLSSFFYYNVFGVSQRRRRIFMGDTGSLTLGFSISFLIISYVMNNKNIKPFSEDAIVTAFSTVFIPVFDVARVMWYRFRKGKPLFQPDRNHIHHKFLYRGFSHHAAMSVILVMAFLFSMFNVFAVEYINNNIVILFDLLFGIGFYLWLDHSKVRKKQKKAKNSADENRKTVLDNQIQTQERAGNLAKIITRWGYVFK